MFMNNEQDIIQWLYSNINYDDYIYGENDYFSISNLQAMITFKTIDNQLIVDFNKDLKLYRIKEKELPIKFGTVNGNFCCYVSNLESFKGFPEVINGYLRASNSCFKSGKDWNIKDIKGSINLCGENCELENLDFLKNTKFRAFDLKMNNTPFKDDKLISELNDYKDIKLEYDSTLYYDELEYLFEYKTKLIEEKHNIEDYLNSFNNELEKDIKECF